MFFSLGTECYFSNIVLLFILTNCFFFFSVILSNYYDLPFNDILDWHKFSIILKESDVYQLKSVLKSISNEEFIALHNSLVEVRRIAKFHDDSDFNYLVV